MDVKQHVFMDSLRRFNDTVTAAPDHGRAAKIVVYARHSFSLGTREHCDSSLHTIPEVHQVYTLKVTGSLHFASNLQYSPLEHCTTIFV